VSVLTAAGETLTMTCALFYERLSDPENEQWSQSLTVTMKDNVIVSL